MSLIVALMTNPQIICLDEPTNGLDVATSNTVLDFISRIVYYFIFVAGLLTLLSSSDSVSLQRLIFIFQWFAIQTVLTEAVYNLEVEIRTKGLLNLMVSKTDIEIVYL